MIRRLRGWAQTAERDVVVLWLAERDPRTPWYVKLLAGLVAAYALSPIDLIPDFIPIIGYLDDLILIPLGVVLIVTLIPKPLMAELRRAANILLQRPVSRTAAFVISFI